MSQPAKKPSTSGKGVEEMVRAYDGELRGFLQRRLRGYVDNADDISQEIYLRILRFSDSEFVREPRAYLFRVARNVLHDRSMLVDRERATFDEATAGGITEDHAARIESARDLERILAQLPPLQRAVLHLRTSEGWSYSEIAIRLCISQHTVKKYMHLALFRCRVIAQMSQRVEEGLPDDAPVMALNSDLPV